MTAAQLRALFAAEADASALARDPDPAAHRCGAHVQRRPLPHAREVLRAMRAADDHQHGRLPDDAARDVAGFYHARRQEWRGVYATTEALAAADDADARAVRRDYPRQAVTMEVGR